MSTVVKVFEYTGTLQIAALPPGVSTIDLYLWGGAGGSGGADQAGSGADGAAGHYVQATGINVSAYGGNKFICVAVGGTGQAGAQGTATAGGVNGKSMTGYSGGTGGPSGSQGTSGSGGGGGGATLVTMYENGQTLDNIKLGIAGGGAGSGGSGYQSRGGPGINTNTAVAGSPSTLGENGAGHSGDGGGGGAGGGGTTGGKGGSGATGDAGGHAGKSGANTIPGTGAGTGLATASSETNGSGRVPGTTNLSLSGSQYGTYNGVQLYTSSRAYGGELTLSGKNGKAVVVFNIPAEARVKDSGQWKSIPEIKEKISGTWKKYIGGYYKVAGVWKAMFSSDIEFTSVATGFGNPTGLNTSGLEGTGGVVTAATIPTNAPVTQGGNDHDPPPAKKCYKYQWGPNAMWGGYDEVGAANPGASSPTNSPGHPSNDGGSGGSSRVICTYFYSKGQFDLKDLQLDTEFSRNYLNDTVKIGYWFWAIPLVKWMEKHEQSTHWWPKLVIKATKLFAQTRSVEISYKMGGRDKGSILGKLVRLFGETGCYLAGLMIRPFVSDKYATFLKDYKKDVNLIR